MSDETIREMTDERARLVMLRAVYETLGDVPIHAQRLADGGFLLTLRVAPEVLAGLRCADCNRDGTDNIHRADPDCEDREAHLRDNPYELHHPFVVLPSRES